MTHRITISLAEADEAFLRELKAKYPAHARLDIQIVDLDAIPPFTETDFWNSVGMLDWTQEEEDEKVVEPLIAFLAEGPIAHIYRFSDILAEKLWNLDTYAHAKVFLDDPEEEGYLSVDDFLYTRCAVVANGKEYYEKVLQNPQSMPPDLTFEPLLYVALKAYKRKTGNDFTAVPAYNYETYSNEKGWEDFKE